MMHPERLLDGPELVFGLVAAIGTDLDPVCVALDEALVKVGYRCEEPVRLSRLLEGLPSDVRGELPQTPQDARYSAYMDAGNHLRKRLGRGDALAMMAVGALRAIRQQEQGDPHAPLSRRAYILRSLKHPDEVGALRRIYGPAFFLLAAYSPRQQRLQHLARKIAESRNEFQFTSSLPKAQELMHRDEAEVHNQFGQNVRKVFPQADFFLDANSPDNLGGEIERMIALLLGNSLHTPTRDEYGMFHAQAASLRSSSLQRQVGAVVATAEGDIIAVGANEVPKPGGGLYWAGDRPDHRDFNLGYEPNDRLKRRMLAELLQRFQQQGWLAKEKLATRVDALVEEATSGPLKDAQLMNIIEFGRCVHAEMAALVDASRRGVAVNGCTLYTTTFPCHECARHIVAAGIHRVVYVEPYPKSLASELYPDSIAVEQSDGNGNQLHFEAFVGVAPRRYMDLFTMTERKDKSGNLCLWNAAHAMPRLGDYYAPLPLATALVEAAQWELFASQLAGLPAPDFSAWPAWMRRQTLRDFSQHLLHDPSSPPNPPNSQLQ